MLENVFMLGQRSTDNATIKLAAVQIEFQCLKATAPHYFEESIHN